MIIIPAMIPKPLIIPSSPTRTPTTIPDNPPITKLKNIRGETMTAVRALTKKEPIPPSSD